MTKKTLVSMITGALVIGAASTTFAAANPFSDVPADSWAYDAVSKLASDGIINGYTDGTYKGQNTMTRYEMAQIVAKAMTKTDMDKADKALVDKLAAEFSEELDNLGVRVSDLEKKSDNVKWGGKVAWTYEGNKADGGDRTNDSNYELRLQPKMFIGNSGWTGNARIRYFSDSDLANNGGSTNGSTASDKSDTVIDRIYAEGPLFGATAKLGKLDTYSDDVMGSGMIMDDNISGAQFKWHVGDKNGNSYVKAVVGRYDYDAAKNAVSNKAFDGTGDYASLEVGLAPKDSKLTGVLGYYSMSNMDARRGSAVFSASQKDSTTDLAAADADDSSKIWSVGAGYKFDKNVNMYAVYSKSSMDDSSAYLGDDQSKAYDITLNYKGADMTKPGSWGLYTAYRYLGDAATVHTTYDGAQRGYKGWEIGGQLTVAENIVTTLRYFNGKELAEDYGNQDANFNRIYGSVEFFF